MEAQKPKLRKIGKALSVLFGFIFIAVFTVEIIVPFLFTLFVLYLVVALIFNLPFPGRW